MQTKTYTIAISKSCFVLRISHPYFLLYSRYDFMTMGAVTLIKFSVVYRYVGAVLDTGGFIVWVPIPTSLNYDYAIFQFFKAFPHGNIFVHCKFIVHTIGFNIVFWACALGLKKNYHLYAVLR